ncbi:hypothetical protein GARC_3019 [Paraglaciecola arctica BSs20135]|uniref:Uncharacterized protein n=1 Tax=Paraglaciecola arctica BSs20135 TaxID=493475 RepID=K6YP82_9ALTE|nr:hypothetical protein GARC_3019 [Paraglaciecola arctica BSs20135]
MKSKDPKNADCKLDMMTCQNNEVPYLCQCLMIDSARTYSLREPFSPIVMF